MFNCCCLNNISFIKYACIEASLREDTAIKHYARGMVDKDIGRHWPTVLKPDVSEGHISAVADVNVIKYFRITRKILTSQCGFTRIFRNKMNTLTVPNAHTSYTL